MLEGNNPILLSYFLGAVVAAILLGFVLSDDDDIGGAWFVALVWPIAIAVALLIAIIAGPFWLGRQLRKLFP